MTYFVIPAKAGIPLLLMPCPSGTPAFGFPSKYYFDGVPPGVTVNA
ncbi:MAG: hypothetical protein QOJ94_1631 [Sphingomonadales bacterium]|jgi:hypothetical protein|nr:hypothetical protein [Sphingomonadales bacterium]